MFKKEQDANNIAVSIVTNSALSSKVFKHIYSSYNYKMSDYIDTSNIENKVISSSVDESEWKERKYDVAFIVSNLGRQIKGPDISGAILSSSELKDLNKLIIGNGDPSKHFSKVENVELCSRLSQQLVMSTLAQCKIVLLTSYFDASPNLLNECISKGVIPLCSQNIGNADILLHNNIIVKDHENIQEWVNTIKFIIDNGYDHEFISTLKSSVPLEHILLQKTKELIITDNNK